jgi:hypothetical protein
MSLGVKLVQAVQKEAAMKRPFPIQAEAHASIKSGRKNRTVSAQVRLCDEDRLSHLAEKVVVHVEGPGRDPETSARRFSEKTTYLSEALQFVECDAQGSAIVRSTPQTMRAKGADYFEAKVGKNEITLCRYQAHSGKPGRAAIPFCVTDETLSRLADDASQVLVGKVGK